MSWIGNLLSGGFLHSIEKVALEVIETDKESAEAKSLWIKTLDPNGKLRRNLSNFACAAYGYYLIVMSVLLFMVSFGFGDAAGAKIAAESMVDLFLPVTTAWGAIVGASFGVNAVNANKQQ